MPRPKICPQTACFQQKQALVSSPCHKGPCQRQSSLFHFSSCDVWINLVGLRLQQSRACPVAHCHTRVRPLSTNFYDDYPCIEPELTAHSARLSFEMLLDLLGWKYATDGTKALPFIKECDVLRVRFNLNELHCGSFSAGNKPSRIAQLESNVGSFLADGSLRKSEAHSLAGQFMFAAGHCIGNALRPSIAILQSFAVAKVNERQMLEDLVPLSLKHVAFCLNSAAPRIFSTTDCREPVVIFTDGSFEPLASGIMEANIGSLVVDTATGVRKIFDGKVPQKILDLWRSTVGL